MALHAANGLVIAKALESNPRVKKVIYPGLESHPQNDLYKQQMRGFGGMIAFYIKGGLDQTRTFASSLKVFGARPFKFLNILLIYFGLKIFTLAVSLGGPESLVEIP